MKVLAMILGILLLAFAVCLCCGVVLGSKADARIKALLDIEER